MACDGVFERSSRNTIAAAALAIVAAMAAASDAHATPPAAPPVDAPSGALSLSLTEAMDRAEKRAPEVVLAAHAVREAQAQRVGAGVVLPTNPRLSVDARPLLTGDPFGHVGYAATLETLFEVGGAPSARVREAERHQDVAIADHTLERLRGRIVAWIAYLQVRIAEMRIEESKALAGIAERILHASQQRGAMGATGDIEASLATADLGQLRAAIQSATREREEHVAWLRDILDLAPTQAVVLSTPLDEPPPPPDKEALLRRAIESRPELAQIRARLAYLDARYERLGRERFPKIGPFLGVDASPASPAFGMVGVAIELPFAQRNQGPRAVTEAARATEVERRELQSRRILREVAALHAAYESRRAELKVIEGTSVPAAARTLELVEVGWLAGRFDMFRVASAARDVARIRAARLDALEGAWLARIALERAAGGAIR